jgi:alanine-synthesizing transaminase
MEIHKSKRLDNLKYEIRGPVYEKALILQNQGYKITSLNIGNPATFGFETPDEIVHDIIVNIRNAQGYVDSRGLFAARKAVMQYYQNRGVKNILIEDIYIGNGVSELISLVMMALLNTDDEVLIPSPDYPLWTTVVGLAGGNAVHYECNEEDEWNPNLSDIESKISLKTRAIVLINPNNPTGAVYSKQIVDGIVKLAEKHNLILFSDEIYDKIIYDDSVHHSASGLSDDILIVTMGGLSKNYRAAGFRGGWMILTGAKHKAKSYIEGLNFLFSTRLCANVITQYGIQTALGGYQSIDDLVNKPNGRLYRQMNLSY